MSAIQSSDIASNNFSLPSIPHALPDLENAPTGTDNDCLLTGDPQIDEELLKVRDKLYYVANKRISFHDGVIQVSITTPWTPKNQIQYLSEWIPDKTRYESRIDWTVKAPERTESDEKKSKQQQVSTGKLPQIIENTAPKGTHVHKVLVGPKKMGGHNSSFPFAVVHIASTGVSPKVLTDWQESLIKEYRACTHLVHTHMSQSPLSQLKSYADDDGILRSWDRVPSYDILINSMKQPELTERHFSLRPGGYVEDLTHLEFVSNDEPGIDDPEDMMHARYLPGGNIELTIAIAYVAPFITTQQEYEYLMRCGDTIYGKEVNLHNIGEIYKATSLFQDQPRYVLAVRSILSPEKGVIHSDFFQARAINRRPLQRSDFHYSSGSDQVVNALLDATNILRGQRLNSLSQHNGGRPNVDTFVMENCIHAYNKMTLAMQAKDIPVFYRVHSPPNRTRLRALQAQIRNLGYPRTMQNLNYADSFKDTLDRLSQDGHHMLVREIEYTILTQGRYQVKRGPHHDLNLDCHGTTKFRKLAGAYFQVQMHNYESGNGYLSYDDLRERQYFVNRQSRKSPRKILRLRVFEEARQQISQSKKVQFATLTGEYLGKLPYIDIPGVQNKALLLEESDTLNKGQFVGIRLEGIDTSSDLFLYRRAALN